MKRQIMGLCLGILGTTVAAVCARDFSHLAQGRSVADAFDRTTSSHVVASEPLPIPVPGAVAPLQVVIDAQPNGGSLRPGPTITGTRLGLKPGETATHRALQFQEELAAAKLREDALRAQASELQKEIEQKNAKLEAAARELNSTRQELVGVRTQLESWSKNMSQLRGALKAAESENQTLTRTHIKVLQEVFSTETGDDERTR